MISMTSRDDFINVFIIISMLSMSRVEIFLKEASKGGGKENGISF